MFAPKPNEGGTYTPPPAGSHPAVCRRLIDIGTQDSTYKGEKKRAHKILLGWEITDPEIRRDDGQPFIVSQRFTFSMHEKASLRKTLEAWRGVPFKESDFGEGGFDLKLLLNVPCILSIIHKVEDGKTYANIASIMKVPKGMPVPPAVSDYIYLSLTKERFDRASFLKLSDGLQDTIRKSPEYQAVTGLQPVADDMPEHMRDDTPPPGETSFADLESIPF